jgi:ABC-type phosphate/phosphonate transport system ATPase subunit
MLQVINLTKIYDGGVTALDRVSFEVPDGQFLAVIGLSVGQVHAAALHQSPG